MWWQISPVLHYLIRPVIFIKCTFYMALTCYSRRFATFRKDFDTISHGADVRMRAIIKSFFFLPEKGFTGNGGKIACWKTQNPILRDDGYDPQSPQKYVRIWSDQHLGSDTFSFRICPNKPTWVRPDIFWFVIWRAPFYRVSTHWHDTLFSQGRVYLCAFLC